MNDQSSKKYSHKKTTRLTHLALSLILLIALLGAGIFYMINHTKYFQTEKEIAATDNQLDKEGESDIVDGKDIYTGLIAEGDYQLVRANCVSCHSSKLILQNRATRDGWEEMIRWMQATQKLHDLGNQEEKILDYLATYYSPEKSGRRKTLEVDEWYMIE